MHADRGQIVSDSIAFSLASGFAVASKSALHLSIAIRFGAGDQADAFFLAYALPGVLATALATAVRVVLVPLFVRLTEEHRPATAGRIMSTIGMVGLALWSIVALAGTMVSPLYIKVFAPSATLGAQQLAVKVSRWIFAIIPLTWLSEFLRAALNSQRRFVLPPAAESFANALALGLILGLGQRTGIMIVGIGFIAKMVVQTALSACGLKLIPGGIRPAVAAQHRREIGSAVRGLGIRLGGALLRESSTTVERFWSALLEVGTISALSYAQMGTNLLSNVFSTSVATVLLPGLSRAAWREQKNGRSGTTDALRLALFLTAPIAAFTIIFSQPVCQIVFSFSGTGQALVTLTARLLSIYALRIPTIALIALLLTPFYALEDTGTPVKHMALMLGINLALDGLLFPVLGVYGFPVAAVLTDLLSTARGFWLQQRVGIKYSLRDVGRDSATVLACTGVAVLITMAIRYGGAHVIEVGFIGQFVLLGLTAVVGGLAYLAVSRAIGIAEAQWVTAMAQQVLRQILKGRE
jgi:putative peptidoglycan lipid II flippase